MTTFTRARIITRCLQFMLACVVTLALASPVHGAIAHVQSANGVTGSGTSFTITVAALPAGNYVICRLREDQRVQRHQG